MILGHQTSEDVPRTSRLARFGLTTQDTARLANFFRRAFDCREISKERLSGSWFEQSMRVSGGADCVQLALGEATVEVLEFDNPGKPYSPHLSPFDNEFQHLAIVVDDMDRAFERLSSVTGWTAISSSGPQRLPESSGAVTAFKFRDPDGHPLELLRFPEQKIPPHWRSQSGKALFLGIDHSAMSVSDTARSINFYQSLGLHVAARSLNQGIEQELLDGICAPQVDIIALAPTIRTPHVELLFYRSAAARRTEVMRSNDMSATRLIFQSELTTPSTREGQADLMVLDPDGHHLQVPGASVRCVLT